MAKQTAKTPDGGARLRADLKSGQLANCYIFYGEEAYLRNYYLEQLHSKILEGPAEAFNSHRFDAKSFSVQALAEAVEALPVMAERTLVRVDDVELPKLDEASRTQLAELLSDLPEYLCLVLVYEIAEFKLDRRQKQLTAAVEKNCVQLSFPRQSQASLTEWCQRHFRTAGKRISPENCAYLIFQTGGTMTAMKPEIEKLAFYAQGPEITRSDIDACVIPVLDAQVFQIADALAARNFDGAMEKLRTIFQMQQEPIPVLAAIASNLRRLLAAKTLSAAGKGSDELMRVCGMSDYPARKTMSSARNFSMRWCETAVCLCAQTDYRLKTSWDEPERLVELLLLQLAEEARRDA